MRPLSRWLDSQGPDDGELRLALLDAREGPSSAQVEALARRVAERAATRETPRGAPDRRVGSSLARRIALGLGLTLVIGALLWPRLKDEPAQRLPAPRRTAAARTTSAAPPVQPGPSAANEREGMPAREPSELRAAPRRARRPLPAQAAPGDEVPLLQEARRALLAHPAAALALAKRHRAQFPSGLFVEERASIEVEALWRLGRVHEAREAWSEFARRYPRSPYRQRLERFGARAPREL